MVIAIVIVVILLAIGGFIASVYNGLVNKRVRVDEAWSGIAVQLKRRLDLIPNLIETVKGYAKHEAEVFENVVRARSGSLTKDTSPKEAAAADSEVSKALGGLLAVAEQYPDLKASENFRHLQDELTDTEDKIEASRRFYNGTARELNIAISQFPNVLIAGPLGFKTREFFEVDESEAAAAQQAPKVDFSA